MNLRELSKPQWDAALNAARVLCASNPERAEDRARYREAKDALVSILPSNADATAIISEAIRWNSLNSIVSALAGIPTTTQSPTRGPEAANNASGQI